MKRIIVFFLLTVLLGLFTKVEPTGKDVAALEPVKLLYIESQHGRYFLMTDTGQQGSGTTAAQAIADLKARAAGEIFLGTAEHLLIAPQAWESVGRFAAYLRPDCSVTVSLGQPDMEIVSDFLDTHKPGVTINDVRAGDEKIPTLIIGEGGMRLEKP